MRALLGERIFARLIQAPDSGERLRNFVLCLGPMSELHAWLNSGPKD